MLWHKRAIAEDPDRVWRMLTNGFAVVEIDVTAGTHRVFLHNKHPGPASSRPGSGGIERPVDCKFSPDGKSLYVLDFGLNAVDRSKVVGYTRTGVLWRVTRRS